MLGAIADEMRAADWATRNARKRIKQSLQMQESLTATLGRTPTVDEMAESLGVDRATMTEALVDQERTTQVLDSSIADLLAADAVSPEDAVLETERSRYLRAAVKSLPERMRYVVDQIYFHDRSVGELAAELGLTHSAVSQQRAEAIRLMRDGLEQHYEERVAPNGGAHSKVAPARRAAYLARLAETSASVLAQSAFTPAIASNAS